MWADGGGGLSLRGNQLVDVPQLRVGGALDLAANSLRSFPSGLLHSQLGGTLDLSDNNIDALPATLGELAIVHGDFLLGGNPLRGGVAALQSVVICGDLWVDDLNGTEVDDFVLLAGLVHTAAKLPPTSSGCSPCHPPSPSG